MNSLRTRLIVAFSLVAVLPLLLAMVLLGQRVQRTVRNEANLRLATAIATVQNEVRSDAERLTARLGLLARDPQLRRLYLVESAGGTDLRQYLSDQRFLLGLDHLAVTDPSGHAIADAALAPTITARGGSDPVSTEALPAARDSGVRVVTFADDADGGRGLALDAAVPIEYQGDRVGLVRGGMRLDARFLRRLKQTSGLDLFLRDSTGEVLASTFDTSSVAGAKPAQLVFPAAGDGNTAVRISLAGRPWLMRHASLGPGLGQAATLTAVASTATADEALAVLGSTTLILGIAAIVLAVLLASLWSRRLSRPVERLAEFSARISRGEWEQPLEVENVRELSTLVEALERMRSDLKGYRERLAAGERQAAYGQMARKVAHEIKNPLTPIAVSVAGLKRAYEQGQPGFEATLDEAVRTVAEEVQRLKTLLQSFSDLGRFPAPRLARFDVRELLADLAALYSHEIASDRLTFETLDDPVMVTADKDQLRQALINLIQNGLDASAGNGHVRVSAGKEGPALRLAVADDGVGLTAEQRGQLFVPGFTTKAHGSGLGLTIVERIVSDHGGAVEVNSAPDRGTTFVLRLPRGVEG